MEIGEKLLEPNPSGIRKEAVAFAGGMGTMPAFSVGVRLCVSDALLKTCG
ncbi:hypothetical protein HMPREF1113_1329 [Streptococcus oralis SK10]|nr:hypothetical protein HMPREF1113_1329 [Streptococcus oralis SK10]